MCVVVQCMVRPPSKGYQVIIEEQLLTHYKASEETMLSLETKAQLQNKRRWFFFKNAAAASSSLYNVTIVSNQ